MSLYILTLRNRQEVAMWEGFGWGRPSSSLCVSEISFPFQGQYVCVMQSCAYFLGAGNWLIIILYMLISLLVFVLEFIGVRVRSEIVCVRVFFK